MARLLQQGDGATADLTIRGRFPEGYRWLEVRVTNMLGHATVKGIVANSRDVTERRDFQQKLEHQANHDALTGLPNRVLLMDRIDHALARTARHGGVIAVLFLDLDRFKAVNDTSGHETGDQLLVAVAEILDAVVRDCDTLARHGGDEFVVPAEDEVDIDHAFLLAERIRDALRDPVCVGDNWIYSSASIGIAIAVDGDTDAATLLSNADSAMYQAKHAGRDCIEIFDVSLKNRIQHELKTETELREAIERDQLRVQYQPIVDTGSGMIRRAEALVRWQHPERGLLTPIEFIPVAEETGLILAIDIWVLRAACQQALCWDASIGVRIDVSTNVSARCLIEPSLPGQIGAVIETTGIEPDRLCLEVTETALISHPTLAEANLLDLRRLGINIALDDLGTGYSSLTHLQNLPLTHIKIDRSFTAGLGTRPTDTTIIKSTIGLAHDLGLVVIAEGVETADQLALLQTYGCDLAQGHYFSRPHPPEQFEQYLQENGAAAP